MAIRRLDVWPLPPTWRVLIADRTEEWEEAVVSAFLACTVTGPARQVVLASGRTYSGFFAEIRRRTEAGRIDLSPVAFTHLDEFSGVDPFSPGSLSREIREALFPDANPRRGAFAPCDARGPDAAARHEALVRGADLVLLGVGGNGHIAFNEPGTSFGGPTHTLRLTPTTRAQHRAAFAPLDPPEEALTAGLGTILSAKAVLVAASGRSKSAAVRDLLTGPIDPSSPASALRLHDHVTLVLDAEAAGDLLPSVGGDRPYVGGVVRRAADLDRDDGPWLVVAPHPDDASISCGGLLASASAATRKRIVTFSTGHRADGPWKTKSEAIATREAESAAEAAELGAEIRYLRAKGYDTGTYEPSDALAFADALDAFAPAKVFSPSRSDSHPTHRLCRLIVEEGVRAYVAKTGRIVELWTYEGPWRLLERDEVDVIFAPSQDALAAKGRAMARHRSQMERVPFDRGAEALASLRAIVHSESHLGGKKKDGFDPEIRIEAYRVDRVRRVD